MDQSFLDALVQLAKIGSAGVGVAVLLMVFIMIARGKPVDPDTARLRERFLAYGVAFAVVLGLLALIPLLMPQKDGGPVPVRLAFSPNFASQKLRPPLVKTPDGSTVEPEQAFSVQPSRTTQTITIGVDDALNDVENLRKTTVELATSAAAATEQAKVLAEKVAETAPAPAAEAKLETQTQQTQQLHTEVVNSIKSGDFARANALSTQLRTSVQKTNPAVTEIARQH